MVVLCNLSENIEERGIAKGIKIFIQDNLNEGKAKEIIVEKLMKYFELSQEEAETYIKGESK